MAYQTTFISMGIYTMLQSVPLRQASSIINNFNLIQCYEKNY